MNKLEVNKNSGDKWIATFDLEAEGSEPKTVIYIPCEGTCVSYYEHEGEWIVGIEAENGSHAISVKTEEIADDICMVIMLLSISREISW